MDVSGFLPPEVVADSIVAIALQHELSDVNHVLIDNPARAPKKK
jgi:hypothetical protein